MEAGASAEEAALLSFAGEGAPHTATTAGIFMVAPAATTAFSEPSISHTGLRPRLSLVKRA